MMSPLRWILPGSGLSLILLATTPSFATVVENLGPSDASITVTPNAMMFSQNDPGGSSSTVTPTKSSLAANAFNGSLNGSSSLPADSGGNFTTSGSSPDASAGNCNVPDPGQRCYLEIGSFQSPIILTYLGMDPSGSNSALLGVGGIGSDGLWTDDLQTLFFNQSGNVSTLNAAPAGFMVCPTDATPEPRFIAVIALAALLAGIGVVKLRRQEA